MKENDMTLVKISCPYCGTSNPYESKTCEKCGNRIPKSAFVRAMESKTDEPPIAISEKKSEQVNNLNRKAISPLKRRNVVGNMNETKNEEQKVPEIEVVKEPVNSIKVDEVIEKVNEEQPKVEIAPVELEQNNSNAEVEEAKPEKVKIIEEPKQEPKVIVETKASELPNDDIKHNELEKIVETVSNEMETDEIVQEHSKESTEISLETVEKNFTPRESVENLITEKKVTAEQKTAQEETIVPEVIIETEVSELPSEEIEHEKLERIVETVSNEIELDEPTQKADKKSTEISPEIVKEDSTSKEVIENLITEDTVTEQESIQEEAVVPKAVEEHVQETKMEDSAKTRNIDETVNEPTIETTETVDEKVEPKRDASVIEPEVQEQPKPVEIEEESSDDEDDTSDYVLEQLTEPEHTRDIEDELNDEIILHDVSDDEDEVIEVKPQNDIVKIKNDISEYLKAQEEIDLDTTVCLNVKDVQDALYREEHPDEEQMYPNLEGEIYDSSDGSMEFSEVTSSDEEHLYEEDFTDLETREYQLDMQVLEDNKKLPSKDDKEKLITKIKTAHKESKEKKAADETRLNLSIYFLGTLLRPLNMFNREENKLDRFKNVIKLALVIIVTMTVFGLLKEMLNVVRVTSFWTGETSWVWGNLSQIEYFRILGENLLIYGGIIFGLSGIYYIVSAFMRKRVNLIKLIAVICTSFIPFGICYGLLSLVLSIFSTSLGIIITIIGFIYSMLILLELIDGLIAIEEKNKRLIFHLISLSILFIIIALMSYSYLVSLA